MHVSGRRRPRPFDPRIARFVYLIAMPTAHLFLRPLLLAAPFIFVLNADSVFGKPGSPAAVYHRARKAMLRGEDDKAVEGFQSLADDAAFGLRAVCALAELDGERSRYEKGIERLHRVRTAGQTDSRWHTVMGALLAAVGRYDDSIRHHRRALELDPDNLRARRLLARLLETVGRFDEAVETYRAFDRRMTEGALPERAEELTDLGLGFYRYSLLTRHRNIVARTRHVLTEVFQDAFDFVDADYWPARLAAAELLLEKHNLAEARADFQRILEQNPRAAAAHVGLGRIALEDWDFEKAESHAEDALEAAPQLEAARLLLGDTRMTERRYADAENLARRALETNPHSIDALSLLAAAQLRQGRRDECDRTTRRIEAINPRPAVLHYTLGKWLAAGRQFDEAKAHLSKAIDLAPWWPEPRTDLGQVYMETGEEEIARQTLDAAFALDSFNARTHNVLELLDVLERFSRRETPHFIIEFDGKLDGIIADYFADVLESLYADVCADYGFEPKAKTIIEVFPDHMGFSVRVTGRPFIATVGACSGRVIALQAPRGGPPFGRFNWSTVLRHEFTHTVTLGATENRIPHWMTEGLAVLQEPTPRGWQTKHLLNEAIREDRLFTLQSIDWGFIRPKRPDDRQLAYAQSEWMLEYAIDRHGFRIVGEFLEAFRAGKTQTEAFESVLGLSTETFDRNFHQWAVEQAAAWGLPSRTIRDPGDVLAALEENRDDPALWAQLAESRLAAGEPKKAEEAARRALSYDEKQPVALEILSHVLIHRMLAERDEDKRMQRLEAAAPFIRRLSDVDPNNPVAIKYQGYLEQAWEEWPEAIERYTEYQRRMPDDPDSYRRLAGIYLHLNRTDDALGQLEQLFRIVENEPHVARTVAEIYASRNEPKTAAAWYQRAIEVDPYDARTHAGLAEAALAAGDLTVAEREFNRVVDLWPEKRDGYDGLSRVFEARGDPAKAGEYREKVRRLKKPEPPDDQPID